MTLSGLLLGGRYALRARLGHGGMGAVYRGYDTRLKRSVAIKLLHASSESPEGQRRFQREARALAQLRHPNIVQVFDTSAGDDDPGYLIMEEVAGRSLQDMLTESKRLPSRVVIAVGAVLADALAHAHAQGIVHRDVSPGNVLIETSGRLVLVDFGIAKPYQDPATLGETVAGQHTAAMGTPEFMAPEQLRRAPLGPYTDCFALGSLLYALASGDSPFARAPDPVEVLRRILDVEYQPLQETVRSVDTVLAEVVGTCLRASPGARPSAREIAGLLERRLQTSGGASASEVLAAIDQDETVIATAPSSLPPVTAVAPRPGAPIRDEVTQRLDLLTVPGPALTRAATTRRLLWRVGLVALVGSLVALAIARRNGERMLDPTPIPVAAEPPATTPRPSRPVTADEARPEPIRAAPPLRPTPTRRVRPKRDAARNTLGATQANDAGEATLVLTVRPWAAVTLDGRAMGNTPLVRELSVSPGQHRLRFEHPRYGVVERSIEVLDGDTVPVELDLRDAGGARDTQAPRAPLEGTP
ncbi:MAG: protein kinase [Myxococcota bacterium]